MWMFGVPDAIASVFRSNPGRKLGKWNLPHMKWKIAYLVPCMSSYCNVLAKFMSKTCCTAGGERALEGRKVGVSDSERISGRFLLFSRKSTILHVYVALSTCFPAA